MSLLVQLLFADCVSGAKDKTSFIVLDDNTIFALGNTTIVLKGGLGYNILIKTSCNVSSSSKVQVLKDNFCSYDRAVLYIDGQVCDANEVKNLN